jgi:predicted TIM-barrel fold metal-dependent hydrolase
VRRIYDAWGPDRMIWGGLGMNMKAFDEQVRLLDELFAFAPEAAREKIRGANAMKLFRWKD